MSEELDALVKASHERSQRALRMEAETKFFQSPPADPVFEDRPCADCGASVTVDNKVPTRITTRCRECGAKAEEGWRAHVAERERNEREEFKRTKFAAQFAIPPRYAECSFEGWSGTVPHGNDDPGWHKQWAPKCDRNVVLYGGAGIGKTHLAVSLLRERWESDSFYGARFFSSPDLNGALLADIRNNSQQTMHRLSNVPVLLLDDVSRVRATPFVADAFAEMMYARHANNRATILTMNGHPKAMYEGETGDAPTWSRILENAIVVGDWTKVDRRIRK